MVYLETGSNNPHFNLAFEQYVFDEMDISQEYFMLWQNDNAVIVGKHQNTFAEINHNFVKEHGISVVRRLSGGGAVYHDMGNLNFTFIVHGGDLASFDFSHFCKPVVRTLRRLGVPAQVNGRNDMVIEGRKFSGNSQYSKKGRVMHHGTLMFGSNLEMVSGSLAVAPDKIESKGHKSVRSRVTNIREHLPGGLSLPAFKAALLETISEESPLTPYTNTPQDLERVREIQRQVYDRWDWNFGTSPRFTVHKSRRIEGCGKLDVYLDVEQGVIRNASFFGDYFSSRGSGSLVDSLVGRRVEWEDIQRAVKGLDIGAYFNNMTAEQFVSLVAE